MTVSDNDLKIVSALVFGTLVVILNTLPFIFRIINKTKEAKESDNFNLFIVILNSYFFLLMISVGIATIIYIIDLMDELDYLNLTGSGGAFSIFWTTGVDDSSSVAKTASYLIMWVRSFYEWLCFISAFVLITFGFIGGYQYQKKLATKNGQDIDYTSYFAGCVGVFLAIVLLKLYSYVTKFSLFIEGGDKEIIQVIKETLISSML